MMIGIRLVACFVLLAACTTTAQRQGSTELIRFSDNGAWCWYQDERVVVDTGHPGGPMLLLTAISFGKKGDPERGDLDLFWLNIKTGERGEFELHDQFEPDDHDVAALYVRPDGRYLAVYSKHSSDRSVRWRISKQPHDPTAWAAEQTFVNKVHVCYSNVFLLDEKNGQQRLYDFTRSDGFDPNYLVSDDQGTTWRYGGKLHTGPGGNKATGQRPYVKYAAFGTKALHFVTTDGHPRNEDNSIYHGVLSRGQIFGSRGEMLGALSETRTSPIRSPQMTTVLASGAEFGGVAMRHAWTIDLHVDAAGKPWTVISARADDHHEDHRFLYARWTGRTWDVHELAKAGGYLYKRERDYTGLVALHPQDPNVLFVSTNIDPRDDQKLDHYELFYGATKDGGASWTWAPITWDSKVDNLRPVVPIWKGDRTALLWLRGGIRTYNSWQAEVVGRITSTGGLSSLVVPGQQSVRRTAAPK